MILLLNDTHPVTDAQLAQLSALLGAMPAVRDSVCQVDRRRPVAEVARDLAEAASLTPRDWQTLPLVINPLALAPVALALAAEVHGRCGHFVPVLNICPVANSTPRYEVAEIVNLQAVRDTARQRR